MLLNAASNYWSMSEAYHQPVFMNVECVPTQSQSVIRYLINRVIATQQGLTAWWLERLVPVAKGTVRIPEGTTFCLFCCHKPANSKAMGEGKDMKLCEDGVGWNCENKLNVRPLREERICSPECGTYCTHYPCYYYF